MKYVAKFHVFFITEPCKFDTPAVELVSLFGFVATGIIGV